MAVSEAPGAPNANASEQRRQTIDEAVTRLESIKLSDPDFYEERLRGIRESILAGSGVSVEPDIKLSPDEASQALSLLDENHGMFEQGVKGTREKVAEVEQMARAERIVERLLALSKKDKEAYSHRRQELDMYLQFGTGEDAYAGTFKGLTAEELRYIATRLSPHKK